MRRLVWIALLWACVGCTGSGDPAPPSQPDAAAIAAAEANPVYQQYRRRFNAAFQAGDPVEALSHARDALAAEPILRDPYVWVSTLCHQMGRNQEAIRLFRETAETHPDLALPWFYKGFNEFHLSLFDDALASFERAGELDPSDAETWYRQGMIYYAQSDFDSVSRLLEKSYALDPLSEPTVTTLADVLRIQGNEERAGEIVEDALERTPDSAKLLFRRGLSAVNARDDDMAEQAFRKAIRMDPAMREPYEQLAGLLSRTGRQDESRRYDNMSTRLNDYDRNSRLLESRMVDAVDGAIPLLLAEVELTAGKPEVALRWFRRSLQLGGYVERNAAGQAEALFRRSRIEQGDRMLEAADRSSSRALLAQVARALTPESEGAGQARDLLQRALVRAPNEAQFLRRAADYAAEIGDTGWAEELLERSISAETLSTAPDPD